MTTNFETSDESYQTVLDISKTISKSKEVVNQSKSLWNKLKGFSQSSLNLEGKSVEPSSADVSLLSPTIRGFDSESCYIRENLILKSRLEEMQKEIFFLNEKVESQQEIINAYERSPTKTEFPLPSSPSQSYLNLKLSNNNTSNILEQRLKSVSDLYENQVQINRMLQDKLKDLTSDPSDSKIQKIEQKIHNSTKTLKNLTKRLEKTEGRLSLTTSPLLSKPRNSCFLISHKHKS